MKNLAVIIPTIQSKVKILNKLLTIFERDSAVDEIVLINNAQKEFVPTEPIKKLKIYNQEKNLYVNPSWNLGIELIKNDYFLIINDDILCPYNFCSMVMNSSILDKDNTGLVGLNHFKIKNFALELDDINIPTHDGSPLLFTTMKYYMETGNWASAFFGNKKNYYKIPDKMKIIFGDNYLLKQNLDAGKKNYFIENIICNHIPSSSCSRNDINSDIDDFAFAEEFFGKDNINNLHIEIPITTITVDATCTVSYNK